jgi:hypothetical protein
MSNASLLRNKRLVLPAVLILSTSIFLAFPQLAFAGWIEDAVSAIADAITGWLDAIASALFGAGVDNLNQITVTSVLSAPYRDLFDTTSGGTSAIYTFAKSISQGVIKPVAHSILGLVMLLQLIRISQKTEGNDVLPGLKDIIFLLVFYALFVFLINFAADICELMYTLVLKIIFQIQAITNTTPIALPKTGTFSSSDMGEAFLGILLSLFFWLVCAIAYVVVLVVSYARAFQLYALSAFSPIPFALLGFEETRSWGTGYIKTFLSVCFAGAIMTFVLLCYPLVINAFVNVESQFLGIEGLKIIAISVLLIISLVKSGAWARDILGG